MDAQEVLRVWQRIMREKALQDAVFSPGFADRASEFGLSPDQVAIALEFGRNADAAYWALAMRSWRMEAITYNVLHDMCAITGAMLEAHGHDLFDILHRFRTETGWNDNRSQVYKDCIDVLTYLRDSKEAASIPGLGDAIALELAGHELNRRLAELPKNAWQAPARPPILEPGIRYQRTAGGEVVTLVHVLTDVIIEPSRAAEITLEPGPQYILVYRTRDQEPIGYALITDTAKAVFDALQEPLSLADATSLLSAEDDAEDRARSALTRFLNLGVIRPIDSAAANDEASDVFQYDAAHWDHVAEARGAASTACFDALVDSLVQACGDLGGKRVLDVGVGNGISALFLARQGADVLGIDISERAIEAARAYISQAARASDVAEQIAFEVMDATGLDAADQSFDVVTCLKTLWCLHPMDAAVGEFCRVLRERGRLVVQLWEDTTTSTLLSTGGAVLTRFVPRVQRLANMNDSSDVSTDQFAELARAAGFTGSIEVASHTREFKVHTAAEYWELFRSIADTGYYIYTAQPAATRTAMDEQWAMETSRLRDSSGAVPLTLEWHICTAHKR